MATAKDHRVEIYLDAVTYLAAKARADDVERTLSQHVRYLLRSDIETSIDVGDEEASRNEGGSGPARPGGAVA